MLLVLTVMTVFEYHLEITPITKSATVHGTEVPPHSLVCRSPVDHSSTVTMRIGPSSINRGRIELVHLLLAKVVVLLVLKV